MFDTLETSPPWFPFRGNDIEPAALWLEEDPDGIGPVKMPTGQLAWMVSRHEDVRQLSRDPAMTGLNTSTPQRSGERLARRKPKR